MRVDKEDYNEILELIRTRGGERAERLVEAFVRMVDKDPLTGVYNKGAINERLASELGGTMRGRPLSLALCDIDFFKKINDENGHQKGDELLVSLADLFTRNIRSTDVIGRYGGEEFLITFSGATLDRAYRKTESLRKEAVRKVGVAISGGVTSDEAAGTYLVLGESGRNVVKNFIENEADYRKVKKAVEKYADKVGKNPDGISKWLKNIHSYLQKFPDDYELLREEPEILASKLIIETADEALYAAKESGRNRVLAYGEDGLGYYKNGGLWVPFAR